MRLFALWPLGFGDADRSRRLGFGNGIADAGRGVRAVGADDIRRCWSVQFLFMSFMFALPFQRGRLGIVDVGAGVRERAAGVGV